MNTNCKKLEVILECELFKEDKKKCPLNNKEIMEIDFRDPKLSQQTICIATNLNGCRFKFFQSLNNYGKLVIFIISKDGSVEECPPNQSMFSNL